MELLKSFLPWLKGLIAAFVAAGAQAITLIVVDPVAFNLGAQWKKTLTAALIAGALAAAGYLAKSPIPAPNTEEKQS
jgi:hypothetical protein